MAVMFADPDGFRSTSMASSDQNSVVMDSSTLAAGAVYGGGGGDDPPRVKLLCSFGGSILPRPLDGKLRYVGGETRIVSMPRDVRYEELMARMRELFEGAWVVKYQQPDEDLDALVSVVNDDDVTNMMEEYDKLGAGGEGFTRLRIFLFSQPDLDERGSLASPQFDAADERETERRYVDALNSLSDGKPQSPDGAAGVDPGNRVHLNGDSFFGAQGVDVGVHGHQLNNLRCLTIPRLPSQGQLYSEMEGSWSPAAYYSPGQHTPHDARDFPPSPSTASAARFNVGMGDRFPDDYVMHSSAHQNHYEHVSPFVDSNNMVWLPPSGVVGEMSGFPGNLGHTHSGVYDGNGSCEHCRMAFQRNQVPILDARYYDPRRHHGLPHLEQASIGGGDAAAQFSSSCAECVRQRESYLLNPEMKFDHGSYASEQLDYRPFYNELHGHDRNWGLHHHQLGHHPEEMRGHRNEQYLVDGNAVNFPFMHGSLYNRNSVPLNYVGHDDPRYSRSAIEQGSDLYHDQPVGASLPPLRVPTRGDGGIRYGNTASAYGVDGMYQVPHESASDHAIRRNMQGPVGSGPSYEVPQGLMLQTNGAGSLGYQRGTPEGSPRFSRDRVDDQIQNPWSGHNVNTSQKVFPIDCPPDHYHDHATKPNLNALNQEIWHSPPPELVNCQPSRGKHGSPEEAASLVSSPAQLVDGKLAASCSPVNHQYHKDVDHTSGGTKEKEVLGETNTTKQEHAVVELDVCNGLSLYKNVDIGLDPDRPRHSEVEARPALLDETNSSSALIGETKASDHDESGEYAKERLSFLPKLIASVKKAALEGAEDVNAGTQADSDVNALLVPNKKDLEVNENPELEQNVPKDLDANSDGERPIIPKIEPTTAEMEALAKGLQAIKNDDLEEIRELGSGAYGSVFHGKWKGSDVAIKRIKASCFSGRPSERERLISDFWKEALILSSLHHPNVVAFYGVVRDGPDGTLATVTEFMINGSLKQFLQKKDRTIDRRKRLIIAMDAAFGMEYLHGKNIVHFDLKCENLLVNMRDPQRPVCKIGDLGLSKVRHKTLVSGGIRGTLPWMAPELLSGKSKMVSEKIDVYSFGVVMWELLTGEDPYADMHCASIIGGIVNNTLRPQIPSWCDPEWRSLMEGCWASDPADRPSFSEISQKLRKMAAAINVK